MRDLEVVVELRARSGGLTTPSCSRSSVSSQWTLIGWTSSLLAELLEERLGRDRDPRTEGGALVLVVVFGRRFLDLDLGAGARLVQRRGGRALSVASSAATASGARGSRGSRSGRPGSSIPSGALGQRVVAGDQRVPAGGSAGLVDDRLDILGSELVGVEHEALVPAFEGVKKRDNTMLSRSRRICSALKGPFVELLGRLPNFDLRSAGSRGSGQLGRHR